MQPYLLELYGRSDSYAIAGLAAAIVAATQIIGGYLVPFVGRVFPRRTSFLLFGTLLSAAALALIGLVSSFWLALALLGTWAVVFAATTPVRQAFINGLIPSGERATVLSADNLLASSGGVVFQPVLGKVADAWSYAASYVVGAGIEVLALPFLVLGRARGRLPTGVAGHPDHLYRGEPGHVLLACGRHRDHMSTPMRWGAHRARRGRGRGLPRLGGVPPRPIAWLIAAPSSSCRTSGAVRAPRPPPQQQRADHGRGVEGAGLAARDLGPSS